MIPYSVICVLFFIFPASQCFTANQRLENDIQEDSVILSTDFIAYFSSGRTMYNELLTNHFQDVSIRSNVSLECVLDVLKLIVDIKDGKPYALRGKNEWTKEETEAKKELMGKWVSEPESEGGKEERKTNICEAYQSCSWNGDNTKLNAFLLMLLFYVLHSTGFFWSTPYWFIPWKSPLVGELWTV